MKWIETRVIFDGDVIALAEEAIAALFYRIGLKGVAIEDPDLLPDEGWGSGDVFKFTHHAVTGYFPDTESSASRLNDLDAGLKLLAAELGFQFQLASRLIDEEDWSESWKAFFHPQKITDSLVVKPTWQPYAAAEGETVIEIDPGMAFGTGAHATTTLCIRLIEHYLVPGQSFLDVGTGSGVLMITAAKLGAGQLMGVDNDEVAVKVAHDNLALNGIARERYALQVGDLVQEVAGRYEVVAANILSEVILVLLDSIGKVLAENGLLICSGIFKGNEGRVLDKLRALGFEVLERPVEEEWVAIVARMGRVH